MKLSFLFLLFFNVLIQASQDDSKSVVPTALKDQSAKIENKIASLKQSIQKKSRLEIHNQAIKMLNNKHKEEALVLLKMNSYRNLFPPSYLALLNLKTPLFFTPLLWHISLFLSGLFCALTFFLLVKNPRPFKIKRFFWSLSFFGLLIVCGFLFLKNKVSLIETVDLKSSPFIEAPSHVQLPAYTDLTVLKQTKEWLRVINSDKQTGWLLKSKVFQIF